SKVGEQGQKPMGTMGTMGAPAPQPPQTAAPEMGAAPPPAPAPTMEQPPAPAAEPPATEPAPVVSEVELCEALSRDAKMSMTDIQGGEAIVLMPRGGASLDTVKGAATQLEQAVATVNPHLGASGEPCALFDIGRQGGKVVAVVKDKVVRIQVTHP